MQRVLLRVTCCPGRALHAPIIGYCKTAFSMLAIKVSEFGSPDVLKIAHIETPRIRPTEVLVRLHAAGVNPVDTYIRSGNYGKLPQLPYVPGLDGAGIVEAVGAEVSSYVAGDRVYVAGSSGTYAQFAACDETMVHRLPMSLSFEEGAGIGSPYSTA